MRPIWAIPPSCEVFECDLLPDLWQCQVEITIYVVNSFSTGDFIDIYQQARYNCSQAIFLLTTNAADSEILNYWANHKQQLLNISTRLSGIQHKLQPLTSAIKAAMAGRTSVSSR